MMTGTGDTRQCRRIANIMKQPGYFKRRTKIVCTIGPATSTASAIERLIRCGMNVARFNLSHGTYETHSDCIETVRRVSRRLGTQVAILIDLPGPKFRTGKLKEKEVTLRKDALMTLTSRDVEGDATIVPVDLPDLTYDLNVGDTVLVDDGAIQLRVLDIEGCDAKCRVIVGGVLTEKRGLVIPGRQSSLPYITDILREHISFAVQQKPDYLAASFVSRASDMEDIRDVLHQHVATIPIIAKIERVQAVKEFDRILDSSDGIMVARGDLGVDVPLEKVPLIQKEIIQKCNRVGKPVITATQMLESMVNAARPTRAEVSDVANAILDGTDATMLSAETSIGKYPAQAVKIMAQIARETEKRLSFEHPFAERGIGIERETDELISYSACHISEQLRATAIVAFTQSGSTARRVSKYRPRVPILAITYSDYVSGQLLLHWGVYPFQIGRVSSLDELFTAGVSLTRRLGLARPGDLIVITGGVPIGVAGTTNLLKVEKIS
ncbi:MAG: pyruvate kinase [Chloroflexi bacterium]|nr:pyruvate kinase [Chloroflexota bacterium]